METDGVDRLHVVAGSLHEGDGFLKSDILKQLIPHRIVKRDNSLAIAGIIEDEHIDKAHAVVRAPGHALAVLGELIDLVLEILQHLVAGCDAPDRLPALGPVGTGYELDAALRKELSDVAVLKLVLDTDGIGLDIGRIDRDLLCIVRIDDFVIRDLHEFLVAAELGGQDVVQSLVRAVADREVVVAGIEDPGALGSVCLDCVLIVGSNIFCIEIDRDGLACAGFQSSGLAEADKLDRSLLNTARDVRSLRIELNHALARDGTGVGDLHDSLALAADVELDALKLLLEGGVGFAVAERVSDLRGIVPCALGSEHARRTVGVALAEDRILVAGLIVLVADIDAFGLDDVPVALVVARIDRAVSDIVEEEAEVLHRRSGRGIRRIGVGDVAGRVHRTGDDVSHAAEAVSARKARPYDGGDGRIILKVRDFHRDVRVQDDDDLAVGVGLGQLDHGFLIVGKSHRALEVVAVRVFHRGDSVVGSLGAVAGEEYDRSRILRCIEDVLGVEVCGRLADHVAVSRLKHRPEYRDQGMSRNFLPEKCSLAAIAVSCAAAVQAEQFFIEGNTVLLQRVDQGDGRLPRTCIDGSRGSDQTSVSGCKRVKAPDGDLLACRVERKRTVVLKEDGSFLGDLACKSFLCVDDIFHGREFRLVIDAVAGALTGFLRLVACGTEEGIDLTCPGTRDARDDHRQHKK